VYRITFVISEKDEPRFHAQLRILLDALMAVDMISLKGREREIPPLYESGIYYEEEPPGQEDWQDLLTCMKLKASDCEDLACFRAAELRVRHGVMARPTFVPRVRPNGGNLYHVQVQYPDGRIEDPSRVLGMR